MSADLIQASTLNIENEEYKQNSNLIVEAVPLRDQVVDIVRRMILKGELKSEEQISERQISEMLKISTTPVKEAFRTLHVEGLIYSKPRKGSYISRMAKEHILQIVFMRSALDGVAAYFAAINGTDEHFFIMEQALKQVGDLISSNASHEEISEKNTLFHMTLRKAAGNEYLRNLIMTMRSADITFREMSLNISEEPNRAYKEHVEIFKAVSNRESDEAEKLMIGHIRRVALFVMEDAKR